MRGGTVTLLGWLLAASVISTGLAAAAQSPAPEDQLRDAAIRIDRAATALGEAEAVTRLAASGAAILTTRTDGAVTLTLRGGRAGVTSFRSGRNLVLPASGTARPSGGVACPPDTANSIARPGTIPSAKYSPIIPILTQGRR